MDSINKAINPEKLRQIEAEVALINQNCLPLVIGYLKNEIFELLENFGSLIFYPFEEDHLWGIYICKNEKNYFIINSAIHLEKQIFAAAHELAHSLEIAKVGFEIITADLMTEYVNHEKFGDKLKQADIIANRFAAELLVGVKQLKEQYQSLNVNYTLAAKSIILSDIFLVPFRTIIKRLYETNLINEEDFNDLLEINDEIIVSLSERYESRRRNLEISREKRLGGYVNKALTLYENDLCSFDELKNNLALIDKTPEEFDIIDDNFDVYDFLQRITTDSKLEVNNGGKD